MEIDCKTQSLFRFFKPYQLVMHPQGKARPIQQVGTKIKLKLVVQMVKYLPAMQETQVRSLVWEDALEKEMATHSSILAWRIPWIEGPGGLWSMESQTVGH